MNGEMMFIYSEYEEAIDISECDIQTYHVWYS